MAKLHFKYASMNSGKSIDLMRTAYNYEENGYNILVMKSTLDTKADNHIASRVGMTRKVDYMLKQEDSVKEVLKNKLNNISCIFVDEAQFLTRMQVEELFEISKIIDIPVLCYGLRTNFKSESFAGGKRLLELADILEELTTLCECGSIARYVGRQVNNEFVLEGKEIVIDGTKDVIYKPLCGKCYLEKIKKIDFEKERKSLGIK